MAVNPAILFANAARSGVGAIKGTPYKPIEWRLKDSSLMKTKLYAGSITSSTISALGSVLGACYGIYNLTQNWDNMHAFDKAAEIAGILQSAAATGATVVNGIETGKQYADFAAKAIEGSPVASDVVKGLGIASAGITTAINVYTAVSGKLDQKNSDNAKEFLKKRIHSRYMERLKLMAESREERKLREGKETSEEKQRREKEFIRDRYERNMLKLSKDVSHRKGTYAGISAVGSMMSVAGFIVPVAGTYIGFGGTAVTMAAGTLSSMSLTGIREQMFDTYFNFDSFLSDAVDELKSRGETVYNMDEFKTRMRRVLAATAGYADVISACDQIAKKYADLICTGLYGSAEERVSGEVRSAYIQLIKSFGLPYDEKKGIPEPSLLARRMNGR